MDVRAGEPQKVGQELSPVGYIARRQTMGVLDFVQYRPGLKQLPQSTSFGEARPSRR